MRLASESPLPAAALWERLSAAIGSFVGREVCSAKASRRGVIAALIVESEAVPADGEESKSRSSCSVGEKVVAPDALCAADLPAHGAGQNPVGAAPSRDGMGYGRGHSSARTHSRGINSIRRGPAFLRGAYKVWEVLLCSGRK